MPRSVLIASLGDSPGAVTTSMDLLDREAEVKVDRLVTLMTPALARTAATPPPATTWLPRDELSAPPSGHRAYEIVEEEAGGGGLGKSYYERTLGWPQAIELFPHALAIERDDIISGGHAVEFLRLCLRELLHYHTDGWGIHVSVSGGRKAMSSLLLLAAQVTGLAGNAFCAVTTADVEAGADEVRSMRDEERTRCLHPATSERWFLPLGVDVGGDAPPVLAAWVEKALHEPADAFGAASPAEVQWRGGLVAVYAKGIAHGRGGTR